MRPGWSEDYWRRLDKQTAHKLRTICPRCGSDKTYYNAKFKVWRCGACEHSWAVKGINPEKPWWKRWFGL